MILSHISAMVFLWIRFICSNYRYNLSFKVTVREHLYCYESLIWSEFVYDCNYVTLGVFNEMITSSLQKKKKKKCNGVVGTICLYFSLLYWKVVNLN
jgi:hypothetical protein